jgi:hypothetical protein
MRRKLAPGEKPLFWIGSSKRDLLAMPDSWFVRWVPPQVLRNMVVNTPTPSLGKVLARRL